MKNVLTEKATLSYALELEYIANKWLCKEVSDFMDLVDFFNEIRIWYY